MLNCSISLRHRRATVAAEIVEAGSATDTATIGTVFAALVDDPASAGEFLDAYLGVIMLEAASAADTCDIAAPGGPAPTFVNAGTVAFGAVISSPYSAAAMPASIVAGNLLISVMVMNGRASTTLSVSGTGWTIGDQFCLGATFVDATCLAWAWKIATGGDAAPSWSWSTGNGQGQMQNFQITGNASAPIGTIAKNSAQSSTTVNVNGIATTQANSLILGLIATYQGNAITTPASYTNRAAFNNAATGAHSINDQTVAVAGATSSNLTTTITSSTWVGMLAELKGV